MLTSDNPTAVRDDAQIDRARLSSYLVSAIEGLSGEAELFQFNAGHSNLTYLVKFGDRELVLKRAPPGQKAKSAHDMGREFHILSRLYGNYPYAPRALAYCDDPSVAGSAFCVMERSHGVIIRSDYPDDVPAGHVSQQLAHLIDALTDLHALDVAAVGLAHFGRPEGYRRRQLDGWSKRLDAARTDDMLSFDTIRTWLAANLPQDREIPAVVHNDFKLDNLVWEPADIRRLKSVLDWEMSTVGDGVLDLACTLSFWVQHDDPPELLALRAMPTARPGALRRRDAIERYATRTGRALPPPEFLLCFGLFRRAVIEQQKYARYRAGATTDARFSQLDASVRVLRDMCVKTIAGDLTA